MQSNSILFLSSEDIKNSLPMKKAISVMKDAFIQLSSGQVQVPLRTRIDANEANGKALFMPVYSPKAAKLGLKTVTIFNDNFKKNLPAIHALVMVFDGETGKPVAVLDGENLTAIRTGAASGLATDLLANPDADSLFIIGTGKQAQYQLLAVSEVRPLKKVWVYDINQDQAQQFAAMMSEQTGLTIEIASNTEECKNADIICTATSSSHPVFKDQQIEPGTHINGIGSYTPEMQEIPGETVKRSLLIVDSKDGCLSEAGDIIIPIKQNLITEVHIIGELGEIASNKKSGRTDKDQITFFKSVGNAIQDLSAASEIIDYALENNIGTAVNL